MTKRNKRNIDDYKNLLRSEFQNHYKTQKSILKKKRKEGTAKNRITDFLMINFIGWLKHYFKSRFTRKAPFKTYVHSNGIFEIPDSVVIALAADWASDTNESDTIGALMKNGAPDITIHLGDTYYVGAPPEIDDNFITQSNSWPRGKIGSLAIPGNHEFYSSGSPYFDNLLPLMGLQVGNDIVMKQEASYFCLENNHWKILGLDTGYHSVGTFLLEFIWPPDARLDDKVMEWLNAHVKKSPDNKGLVILTHHQYVSDFESEYSVAGEQLKEIFGNRTVLWIFGHEHKFAVYGQYSSSKGLSAYCRCIGNGGMPIELNSHFTPKGVRPLLFYDKRPNPDLRGGLGYNGYSVLKLNNEKISIEYNDIKNTTLYSEEFTTDANGNVSAPVIFIRHRDLETAK